MELWKTGSFALSRFRNKTSALDAFPHGPWMLKKLKGTSKFKPKVSTV